MGHESASYRDVADRFGVTISVLHKIITRVTDFIMSLAPTIICYPTAIEKEETANFYRDKKGFPGIIGNIYLHLCKFIFIFTFVCTFHIYICVFGILC